MKPPSYSLTFVLIFLLAAAFVGCTRPVEEGSGVWSSAVGTPTAQNSTFPTAASTLPAGVPTAPAIFLTPTPDAPHAIPSLREDTLQYIVQSGDTLGEIARAYNITLEQLISTNELVNPDLLVVGQLLSIPPPDPGSLAPGFKILPNSELVSSPSNAFFDIDQYINSQGGFLARHLEEVGTEVLTGAQIVRRVAQNYSVNPRLLLAVLEYQSKWVTQSDISQELQDFPIGWFDRSRKGLYRQLAFAANNLNYGYYLWQVNGAAAWTTADGIIVPTNPTVNGGTAGIQHFFSQVADYEPWQQAIQEGGLYATFTALFGNPFLLGYEPLLPDDLAQPKMQLPFEVGQSWSFTGGPHGAWDSGSAWGALDFAPPGEAFGCTQSDAWVVAVTDGLIVRAEDGAVVQDLDGDGLEQTGWTVLYMHIETRGRILVGTQVRAGDRIGHPSCEGGYTNGTHVHLARRYNGEWIPADQEWLPFVLDGWQSTGTGVEYDGFLVQGGNSIEAWNGRSDINQIQR